jgi:two-component system phosphate regulon response regulator PhoB
MKNRILAVDDDATALGVLRQILAQKGYDVTMAGSGEEALERLKGLTPDLVILDVAMPGLSGFETCRRIREAPETHDIPVIFLTAKGLLTDMAEGQDAGSDLYLIKPVLASKLINMVGMFLSPAGPLARAAAPEPAQG